MRIFSRYGYSPGLLRQLKLKIPDGGKTMPANLSLNSPVHGILEKMPNKSGFLNSAAWLGFRWYEKNSRQCGIPIQDARDRNGKLSEWAVLLYNIYQNSIARYCLSNDRSKHFQVHCEIPFLEQMDALYKEHLYLAKKADILKTSGTSKRIPAVAGILGTLATLAITAIVLIVMYLP